jgi:hypothetical protein
MMLGVAERPASASCLARAIAAPPPSPAPLIAATIGFGAFIQCRNHLAQGPAQGRFAELGNIGSRDEGAPLRRNTLLEYPRAGGLVESLHNPMSKSLMKE